VTPEQCQLAADHLPLVLRVARGPRWASWSEAESTAVEVLCQAACRFHDNDSFHGYLVANLDGWLADRRRAWAHSHCGQPRVYAPISFSSIDEHDLADVGRPPDERVACADVAREELAQLPKRTVRIAFLVASGMKKEDIAAELGVSPSAVSQALRFGRERIESYRRAAA
jgi:DNA-directed RNA polymerase specialized sigma24 family protein